MSDIAIENYKRTLQRVLERWERDARPDLTLDFKKVGVVVRWSW